MFLLFLKENFGIIKFNSTVLLNMTKEYLDIEQVAKQDYMTCFIVHTFCEISIQPRTNVGLAITDYTDRLQGGK